jgi:hypothetical protein
MKTLILITGRRVMKQPSMISMLLALGVLFVCTQIVQGQTKTPEEKIQNAMSAAPPSIAKDASIMDWPAEAGGKLTELRKGTNAWTCLPDDPSTPTNDPMCLDKMWMVWLQAWMSKTEPKITAPGIGYMLQGGSHASNTDPFATEPPAGQQWLIAPPHTMVVVPGKLDPAVFSSDPHSGGPWVMWGGTPYEHLMVPVK